MTTSGVIQQLNRTATKSIYSSKDTWKFALLIVGVFIIIASLVYNNILAHKLRDEERKKVEMWATAQQKVNEFALSAARIDADLLQEIVTKNAQNGKIDAHLLQNLIENTPMGNDSDMEFLLDIVQGNTTIPVVLTTDQDSIITARNFGMDTLKSVDKSLLYKRFKAMKNDYPPIEINLAKLYAVDSLNIPKKQYIYYTDSALLKQLKIYPYIQLGLIAVFILGAYFTFSISRRAEQNKVWLGMAKETAHQLGTPLSSMVAWVELLKYQDDPTGQSRMMGEEIEKDVMRLKLIADRFSKIGSEPRLENTEIVEEVRRTTDYIKRRASAKIQFTFDANQPEMIAKVSPTLFDWVIENLLKNALDAMENMGKIAVRMYDEGNNIAIEVSDSGKGIPKSKFNTVFEPGYSTKKRGWGLGLSLSKRIIQNYHKGKIFVKESSPEKGTTFRVIIPKVPEPE
jgi:K+-sensing histidine kinase KdpD